MTGASLPPLPALLTTRWDIGDLYDLTEPSTRGGLNRVFVARTSNGSYIFKGNSYRDTPDKLCGILALLERLRQTDFPADGVVYTKDAQAFVVHDGVAWTLHPRMSGVCYRSVGDLSEREYRSAVRGMAWYHEVVWNLVVPREVSVSIPVAYRDDAQWIGEYLDRHQAVFVNTHDRETVEEALESLYVFFSSQSYWSLPRIVIHGDYRPANLTFQNEDLAGVFDWDLTAMAPRLVDVCGRFAQYMVRQAKPRDRAASLSKFVDLYQGHAGCRGIRLTDLELACVPHMFEAVLVQTNIVLGAFLSTLDGNGAGGYGQWRDLGVQRVMEGAALLRDLRTRGGGA